MQGLDGSVLGSTRSHGMESTNAGVAGFNWLANSHRRFQAMNSHRNVFPDHFPDRR